MSETLLFFPCFIVEIVVVFVQTAPAGSPDMGYISYALSLRVESQGACESLHSPFEYPFEYVAEGA